MATVPPLRAGASFARSSSIIVLLLLVVALAMAAIAHQSDDHTTNMIDQRLGE
jgi:hypothetical protein